MDDCCMGRLTQLLDLSTLDGIGVMQERRYAEKNLNTSATGSGLESFDKISHAIMKLTEFLKQNIHQEGLFRISGSKTRQETLKSLLRKGSSIESTLRDSYTIHDYATVLKLLLADYTIPLVAEPVPDCYRQIADMDNISQRSIKIEALQILLLLLPPINRIVLKCLFGLLFKVAESPSSRMTFHSLAVVFTPNVIFGKKVPSTLSKYADDMEPLTNLIAFMIENTAYIFKIPELIKRVQESDHADIPPVTSYCEQTDPRLVQRDVHKKTTDALLELYAEMSDMPDGPNKQRFLKKFHKMHPGTPPFIPQSKKIEARLRRERENILNSSICSSPSLSEKGAFNGSIESFGSPFKRIPFDCPASPQPVIHSRSHSLAGQPTHYVPLLRRLSGGISSITTKMTKGSPEIKRKVKRSMPRISRFRSRSSSKSRHDSCSEKKTINNDNSDNNNDETNTRVLRSSQSDVPIGSSFVPRISQSLSAGNIENRESSAKRLRSDSTSSRPPLPKPIKMQTNTLKKDSPLHRCENLPPRKRKLSNSLMSKLTAPFGSSKPMASRQISQSGTSALYIKPCLTPMPKSRLQTLISNKQ